MLSVWELNYLSENLTVGRAMTRNVITLKPDDLVIDAAHIMLNRKISCLPVIDEDRYLEGIVTTANLLELLVTLAKQAGRGVVLPGLPAQNCAPRAH